jgi:hypothetical protein
LIYLFHCEAPLRLHLSKRESPAAAIIAANIFASRRRGRSRASLCCFGCSSRAYQLGDIAAVKSGTLLTGGGIIVVEETKQLSVGAIIRVIPSKSWITEKIYDA